MECKVCHCKLPSIEAHASHFDLSHRVTLKSQFTCGFAQCSVKLSTLNLYRNHVKLFHSEPENDETRVYKCGLNGCDYKCKSQSTMRGHRFWKHPQSNGEDVPVPSMAQSHSIPDTLNSGLLDANVDHMLSLPSKIDSPVVTENPEDILLKKFSHLGLTLTYKYHVPDSTFAYILQNYSVLINQSSQLWSDKLHEELVLNGVDPNLSEASIKKVLSDNILFKIHAADGPMRSYYMRQKQYSKSFPAVAPKSKSLLLNQDNVDSKMHYVPIQASLQWLFEDDSVYEQYLETKRLLERQSGPESDLCDLHSGTAFKNHTLFSQDSSALQLIIFADDIEMAKGLGAAADGAYKLTHLSYTLGNLHAWNRSKVDPLQLIMLCKEKDVGYFGLPKVLKPLIDDLKDLEENGITIRGENVKGSVLVLLGDNLGIHTMCGFTENFSTSTYFCRYCEESREVWLSRWHKGNDDIASDSESESESEESDSDDSDYDCSNEGSTRQQADLDDSSDDDSNPLADLIPLSDLQRQLRKSKAALRTPESFRQCEAELVYKPGGVKGVVGHCELNKLKHYHAIGGTPPCVPHDLLEGIVAHDSFLIIKYFAKKYKISYDLINRKIKSFPFLGAEKLDKPPGKLHARRKKVRGNAVQLWVLVRFLPMLLGDEVKDKDDSVWVMLLTLIEIVAMVMSPVVSKSSLTYLDNLIHKYISMRATLFKQPLRPKHHYLEHYVMLILRFGALVKSSTLRFEAKHKFFRAEFRAKNNFKNPTKSLSKAHQMMQSALRIDNLFQNTPMLTKPFPIGYLGVEGVENIVIDFITSSFGKEFASKLMYSHEIIFHNKTYQAKDVLVTSTIKHPQIDLLKISLFESDGTAAYAIGVCL